MDYNSYFKKYNKTIYELINNVNSKLIEQSVKLIQKSIHKITNLLMGFFFILEPS